MRTPTEVSRQRQSEAITAYAARPAGIRLEQWLARDDVAVPKYTWYYWMRSPEFKAQVEHVDELRRRIAVDDIVGRERTELIATAVQLAKQGSASHMRLVFEIDKLITRHPVEFDSAHLHVHVEQPKDLDSALAAEQEAREKVDRFRELLEYEQQPPPDTSVKPDIVVDTDGASDG